MQRKKVVLVEITAGTLLGVASAVLVSALRIYLAMRSVQGVVPMMSRAFILYGAINGTIIGLLVGSLRQYVTRKEMLALTLFVSAAVGSLGVLLGGYGQGSVAPFVIYGISLLIGLLISPITGLIQISFETVQDKQFAG